MTNQSPAEEAQAASASHSNHPYQPNFLSALLALIAARTELIRLESREVCQQLLSRLFLSVVVVISVFMSWILLLVSIMIWCVASQAWSWHWVIGGFAAAHLLVALICVVFLRRKCSPFFLTTREEFKKDRIWLESFQQKRN